MRNLKLTLAYDGTPYHGWQVQPGVPTVQGELERVLGQVLNEPVSVHGSGRTDRGVHALAQVANFRTTHAIDGSTLGRAVNALLPPEVRVISVDEVPLEFHARTSARAKTYAYHLWRFRVVSPFRYRYVYPIHHRLDAELMRSAASQLHGVHDFTSFCAAGAAVENRVREVYESSLQTEEPEWVFRIRASGFLQQMVRTIVGTLIEVGIGRLGWQEMNVILKAKDRRQAGPSAPPQGLHLVSVEY